VVAVLISRCGVVDGLPCTCDTVDHHARRCSWGWLGSQRRSAAGGWADAVELTPNDGSICPQILWAKTISGSHSRGIRSASMLGHIGTKPFPRRCYSSANLPVSQAYWMRSEVPSRMPRPRPRELRRRRTPRWPWRSCHNRPHLPREETGPSYDRRIERLWSFSSVPVLQVSWKPCLD